MEVAPEQLEIPTITLELTTAEATDITVALCAHVINLQKLNPDRSNRTVNAMVDRCVGISRLLDEAMS